MYNIASESELDLVVRDLKPQLQPGQIIVLQGELGAGKTTLVKKIVASLHPDQRTSSPTFTIMNEYPINEQFRVVHADLYRLKNKQEVENLGLHEYFNDPSVLLFIEWPELIWDDLPANTIVIKLKFETHQMRSISVRPKGDR